MTVLPPPLHSNHPGIVSKGARDPSLSVLQIYSEGRILLAKVVLLVHCCVLQISCIQGTPLYSVLYRKLQFFAVSALDVDHIDTYPARAVVNFKRSGGSTVPAKILGPSERGVDDRTII